MSVLDTAALTQPPGSAGVFPSEFGMDADGIPSFRTFLKRVPPLSDAERSLTRRKASNSSPCQSELSISPKGRRSSSIYSQWDRDDVSWHSSDFADEPWPPLPMLQPLAYSASTPHLAAKQSTPPLLQARACSPLLTTPSPSVSQPATPSPLVRDERVDYVSSQLRPRPEAHHALKMIPLDKAILTVHAPGAIHLLPEEHRAQRMRRSKSQEMKKAGTGMMSGTTPSGVPEPLILVDSQGRPRSIMRGEGDASTINSTPSITLGKNGQSFDASSRSFKRLYQRSTAEEPTLSNLRPVKISQAQDFEERRGRTMERVPRKTRGEKHIPVNFSSRLQSDARIMAEEYHSLLPEQDHTVSNPPDVDSTDSNGSLRSHVRMLPPPLFHTMPPAQPQGTVVRFGDVLSIPPWNSSSNSGSASNSASSGPAEYFPSAFSLPKERTHKRMSTSGSIPISPPTSDATGLSFQTTSTAPKASVRSAKTGALKSNKRASAYYPHVASRKGKAKIRSRPGNGKGYYASPDQGSSTSKRPKLPLDIIPASATLDNVRGRSYASSDNSRQLLTERFAKGAAKYAELLTRHEVPERTDYEPITAAIVSPGSPHLTPTSAGHVPKEVHLGWSDTAKAVFDKSVSPKYLWTKPLLYTHITTPARPLDESKTGLKDAEPPRRKSSIFASFLDSWKEGKAERRRQDLKKTIKVFPNPDGPVKGGGLRRSSSFGWM